MASSSDAVECDANGAGNAEVRPAPRHNRTRAVPHGKGGDRLLRTYLFEAASVRFCIEPSAGRFAQTSEGTPTSAAVTRRRERMQQRRARLAKPLEAWAPPAAPESDRLLLTRCASDRSDCFKPATKLAADLNATALSACQRIGRAELC
jgi:hypothetical protein